MASTTGLERTLQLLAKTPNPAAMDLLLSALKSPEVVVRTSAARTVLRRRRAHSREQLLAHLDQFPKDVRRILASPDSLRQLRPWVVRAIRGNDPHLCQQACRYATENLDHQVLSVIVDQARVESHPCGKELARSVVTISRDLAELVYSSDPTHTGSDPAFPRRAALNGLIRAVDSFLLHGSRDLLDAFLTLATPNEPVMCRVLEDTTHGAHGPLCDLLRTSKSRGLMHMLVDSLQLEHPRPELLDAVQRRADRGFVELMLDKLGDPIPLRARETIHRLKGFAWAEPDHEELFFGLTGARQATALKLAAGTSMSKRRLADLVRATIQRGEVAGKVAACSVVGKIRSETATEVLREALADSHPSVVAAAGTQLRLRGIEGSTDSLIEMLEKEKEQAGAAEQYGPETPTYRGYCDSFDSLSESAQRTQGRLVAKADHQCKELARQDLSAAAPDSRLRALKVVVAMGLVDALVDDLIRLLKDPEADIRTAAAEALSNAHSDEAIAALSKILRDADQAVRDTARAGMLNTPLVDLADSLVQGMQQEFNE